jgi:hypothetical protein
VLINLDFYQNLDEKIETLVEEYDIDYIDAVIDYCDKNGLELEVVADVIQNLPNLKAKLEIEAENLHFLKKTARLPV